MLHEVPAVHGHESGEATIKSVINKTRRPIRVSLPGGKTLHLGLGGRGQVPDDALDRPALKKLIEAGEIEVLEEDSRTVAAETVSTRIRRSPHGHPATRDTSRRGDR
jgi:hypothetical protein